MRTNIRIITGSTLASVLCIAVILAIPASMTLFGDIYHSLQPTPTPRTTCTGNGERQVLYTTDEITNIIYEHRTFLPFERVEVVEEYDNGYKVIFCSDNFVFFISTEYFISADFFQPDG